MGREGHTRLCERLKLKIFWLLDSENVGGNPQTIVLKFNRQQKNVTLFLMIWEYGINKKRLTELQRRLKIGSLDNFVEILKIDN